MNGRTGIGCAFVGELTALIDAKTLEVARAVVALLAPGLIFVFARSRLTTGRMDAPKDNLLSYITVSVAYYAVIFAVFPQIGLDFRGSWTVIVLVLPFALGILSGQDIRRGWSRGFFQVVGILPVHPIPTAWDWHFGKHEASWVIITLKSGETIGGWFGADSFASSAASGHDIFIERIYTIDPDDTWHEQSSSLLIGMDEIRSIEFLQ